jgi:hypothetical protein
MPYRVKRPSPRTAGQQDILKALVNELRKPKDTGQPLITEEHMGRGDAVHVHVIWDRWHECPEGQRYEIIRDAYEQVQGPEFAQHIVLAVGVTVPEAVSLGLLPYQVVPRRRETNAVSLDRYKQVMLEEGASTFEAAGTPVLSFTSLEEAEACVRRLEERLPHSYWTVVHEVG